MTQDQPLLYKLDVGLESFHVHAIVGREETSAPFRLEVRFVAEDGLRAEPEELLTLGAVVRLERGGEHVRRVAGVVTEASVSAVIRGAPEVHVVVEPQLALLRHRVDHRVFRDKTVPEIVAEVLEVVGIRKGAEGPEGLALRLASAYEKRPYTVQWQESDLDFVHRLLEDEGIFYYFAEHGGLVLGDSPAAYEPITGARALPFRGAHGNDAVRAIGRRSAASVGKVSLKDFDLEHPSLDLAVASAGPTEGGPEYYDYPGEYADPAVGARKAKLVAEAFAGASTGFAGESNSGRLAPGHVLAITGAPSGVGEGEHVVTRVAHAWKRDDAGFSCAFESRSAETTFRPLRVTPEPRLLNPITGIVTGPAGEDIHTDALGRVKVHFHWDRLQPYDDDCSHWIPVLQDNTGHSVGVPRVGWEVLVHFLEGDPDRPVVLGRMYNAADNFPNALPAGKTKSALKSLSSPGRNGTNQIELDDLAGSEKITVLAEKDQNIVVANDKAAKIQHDEQIQVVRDERVAIGHDQIEEVGGSFTHTVERDQVRSVGASRTRNVSGAEKSTVAGDRSLTIGGMHQRTIGTDDVVQAKNLNERVGAVDLEAFVKTNTTTSSDVELLTVGGAMIEIAKGPKTESTGKLRVETIGGLALTQAGAGISTKVGKARILTVGAAMSAAAQGPIVLESGMKLRLDAGIGKLDAQAILLKVGDSFVLLKDGVAVINAAKTLRLSVDAKNELGSPGIAIIPTAMASPKAAAGKTSGGAADASGKGQTGSGNVDVKGLFAAGQKLVGASGKGPAQKLEALKSAASAGYSLDPQHCNVSMMETLRSYASTLGIRQDTDGQAIPLSGQANGMLKDLDKRVDTYAKAKGADATALRDAGLAWEKVPREDAMAAANEGELVVAGLPGAPGHHGHVATVVPGDGKKAGDGVLYPFVSGGGSGAGASDGTRSAGQVWSTSDRKEVDYYRFVPPAPPAPPPAPIGRAI